MRVSYKWLKELVDVPATPEELAEKMTMSGVAVENIEYLGQGIEKVVTGRLEKIDKHPNADKLVVCQVNAGTAENIQIVTGAPNVREGQVVPVALVGAHLPGGTKIKRSKLRGVESSGMLCSGQELGMDEDSLPEESKSGILILSSDTPLGLDIKDILSLNDTILELELTPNRSDCLSMFGVAREVKAVLGSELHLPKIENTMEQGDLYKHLTINIDDTELSHRYIGRMVKNIKIAPSPQWMQQKLQAAGVRPINNIVDVTNYVMMELGQPLHAFDFDKIADNTIIVRRAEQGEHITTLDDTDRKLTEDMIVIADPRKAVAIAGVMGGQYSEVTADTNTILIESAHFDGASVRRTSRALGLRSEASSRFEKGIDKNGCLLAANRACQLIEEIGAGEAVPGFVDENPAPYQPVVVKLRYSSVRRLLGIDIPPTTIKNIMERLGFSLQEIGGELRVEIPSNRMDITIEADLVEEIARLYGYNKIPTTLPEGATTQGKLTEIQYFDGVVKDVLTNCGLSEVITMSFTNPKVLDMINVPDNSSLREVVTIQNPLSEEQRILRTSLIPGLLDVLARNISRKNLNVAIFESGLVFHSVAGEQLPMETPTIAMALTGETTGNWQYKARKVDFYDLKGTVETLLKSVGVDHYSFVAEGEEPYFHPGRTAIIEVAGQPVGIIGEIHPVVQENYNLPDRVYLAQINTNLLRQKSTFIRKYYALPKYPAVMRDMAFVVKSTITADQMADIIRETGGKLLKEIKIFDVYQGKQIKAGYKSVAFSLLYQAEDRTLTDEEVNGLHDRIEKKIAEKIGAELRS